MELTYNPSILPENGEKLCQIDGKVKFDQMES